LQVRRQLDGHLPALSDEVELVIYRVAQEALTNALRHSEATCVTVSLKAGDDGVVLTVSDDGRGLGESTRAGGLAGMRERAMLIDAALDIRSGGEGGTDVVLRLPISEGQP
jgi:two-component system sensor histidine kinase UhpB